MNKKLIAIGFGLVAVLLLWSGVSIYPEWLWFENLGFSPVFWTMLLSKFGFGFIIWLFLILIISFNLYVAKRLQPGGGSGLGFKAADDYVAQFGLSGRALNSLLILTGTSVFICFLFPFTFSFETGSSFFSLRPVW